jgi:tRNA pseudouridine55 synthase
VTVDGILNINKPAGMTSFRVVALVRQLSGERRVGHAGTLDPTATGVLPVCLGRATRVVEFLMDATKTYRAEIELGTATDTGDASGQIVQKGDSSRINHEALESALASFCGSIHQTPPMYSAIKYRGKPLYRLARAGITIERRSRPAKIYHLELADWQPPVATIEVACGKGTYIRTLASDLGEMLGCGAYLKSLARLRYGPFDVKDAVSISQTEDAFHSGSLMSLLHPVDSVLLHWPAIVVDAATEQSIRNGQPLKLAQDFGSVATGSRCRVYTLDGCFLGVLRFNGGKSEWEPEKVFL